MATLTPTLTLSSSDIFADQPLALTVTDSLTVGAPMTDISRMNTDDNIGNGDGIVIADLLTDTYYVYVKHTGLQSDGITAATATDYVTLSNADGEAGSDIIRLYSGEFAFFPLAPADGTDGGTEAGGLKIAKNSAGNEVQVNYGYWKRS